VILMAGGIPVQPTDDTQPDDDEIDVDSGPRAHLPDKLFVILFTPIHCRADPTPEHDTSQDDHIPNVFHSRGLCLYRLAEHNRHDTPHDPVNDHASPLGRYILQ
jgi:hypothetical protein